MEDRVDAKAVLEDAHMPSFGDEGEYCSLCEGAWGQHTGRCPYGALAQTLSDLDAAQQLAETDRASKPCPACGLGWGWHFTKCEHYPHGPAA
jgi:hypothetical protein